MLGSEAWFDNSLPFLQRIYIRFLGAPEIGAKIRWHIVKKALQRIPEYYSCFDAGCGKGYFSFQLSRRANSIKVTGLDINNDVIKRNQTIAAQLGLTNLRFISGNLLDIGQTEQYDLALSIDNLEHIERDVDVLKQIRKIIKNDGHLIVHVPRVEKRYWFNSSYLSRVEDHVRAGYEAKDLEMKLTEAGFRILEMVPAYNSLQTLANELGTLFSQSLAFYALFLPFLHLLSILPDSFARVIRPVYNSLLVIAVPIHNEFEN